MRRNKGPQQTCAATSRSTKAKNIGKKSSVTSAQDGHFFYTSTSACRATASAQRPNAVTSEELLQGSVVNLRSKGRVPSQGTFDGRRLCEMTETEATCREVGSVFLRLFRCHAQRIRILGDFDLMMPVTDFQLHVDQSHGERNDCDGK